MIKFKINDIEYNLPEMVSIKNYQEIYKIKDLFSDDYFAAKLIHIVCGVPLNDVLESDYGDVNFLATQILSKVPLQKPQFIDRFEIDGVHYGFIPDWKDMTFAEFADLDTLSTKKQEEVLQNLHYIASIMYRPITEEKSEHNYKIEKYNVDKMKERAELFKEKLDVKYVLGAQFFFIKFANRYSNYSQLSSIQTLSIWTKIKLIWRLRKMIIKVLFKKPTDGSSFSTELLEIVTRTIK